MRILFYMIPEHGHHLPTFGLANALRSRGHEVVYASSLDLAPLIEQRGFRCVPVHRDVEPRGTLEELDRMSPERRAVARRRAIGRKTEERLSGVLSERVREIAPDVMLVDTLLCGVVFIAHELGVPCLRVSTTFSPRLDGRPPITSPLGLDASPAELEAAFADVASMLDTGSVVLQKVQFEAIRAGYPLDRLSLATAFLAPEAELYPEIVLSAAALDWPHEGPRPMHFPPPVDVDRVEHVPEELARFVDAARPLVYVSLGSQVGRYAGGASTLASVVAAMRAEPQWRAVIAAGARLVDAPALRDAPENVLVLGHAPQIWLLARAAVFVTHAGMGALREAVALRVPLVAVPQGYDQPGNAARIRHHGIGVHLDGDALTPAGILAALRAVVRDRAAYVARLARLDEAYRREQEDMGPIDAIKRAAAGHAARATPASAQERVPESVLAWILIDGEGRTPEGAVLDATFAWMPGDAARAPELGVSGYVASRTLAGALSRATGSVLARVELRGAIVVQEGLFVGQELRCLSRRDVARALEEYAYWCADAVLEPEARVATDAARVREALAAHRARRAAGRSPTREESAELAALAERCARESDCGLVAFAYALQPAAHEAARLSHGYAIHMLARRAAGERAGTMEAAVLFARERCARGEHAEAELARRLSDVR